MLASFITRCLRQFDKDADENELRRQHRDRIEDYILICLISGAQVTIVNGFPEQLAALHAEYEQRSIPSLIIAPEWPFAPRGQIIIVEREKP